MSASATTLPKRKPTAKRRSRKKREAGWPSWWPVVVGIAITPLALKAATFTALTGPSGLRLLYPYALIFKLHFLALPDALAAGLSQAMMYLQFSLYGLLFRAVLRAKGLGAASVTLIIVHFIASGLLFIFA